MPSVEPNILDRPLLRASPPDTIDPTGPKALAPA